MFMHETYQMQNKNITINCEQWKMGIKHEVTTSSVVRMNLVLAGDFTGERITRIGQIDQEIWKFENGIGSLTWQFSNSLVPTRLII
jgi:hypothetical protein